uniref:Uncharacterized protein n=1 Tax=Candidozyma auris TaxID=498019 RepID=A0A0L0NQX1_CANAR
MSLAPALCQKQAKKKKKNNGRMIYIPAALVEDVMIRWGAVLRIG